MPPCIRDSDSKDEASDIALRARGGQEKLFLRRKVDITGPTARRAAIPTLRNRASPKRRLVSLMLGNPIESRERFVLNQPQQVKRERESQNKDFAFNWQGSISPRPGFFFSPK